MSWQGLCTSILCAASSASWRQVCYVHTSVHMWWTQVSLPQDIRRMSNKRTLVSTSWHPTDVTESTHKCVLWHPTDVTCVHFMTSYGCHREHTQVCAMSHKCDTCVQSTEVDSDHSDVWHPTDVTWHQSWCAASCTLCCDMRRMSCWSSGHLCPLQWSGSTSLSRHPTDVTCVHFSEVDPIQWSGSTSLSRHP